MVCQTILVINSLNYTTLKIGCKCPNQTFYCFKEENKNAPKGAVISF